MDRLSRDKLEVLIENVTYQTKGKKTRCTISVMGLSIVGESFCSTSQMMCKTVGEKVAYENALANLRLHEQYAALRNKA